MKISNTKNISATSALKMVVYGMSGVGKTSLAKTIGEPTLLISAESGLLTLAGADIDVIDISQDDNGNVIPKEKRIGRLGEVYQFLLSDEAKKKYRWVFIDSLTEISQNLVECLQAEFPDRKDSLVLYGENSKRLRSLVKSFRDLPHYNVIFTALSVIDKDESGMRFTTIDLVGNFASKLPGFFDEVFFMSVDKDGKRFLVTESTDRAVAKDRSGRLDKLEVPDLSVISSKIRQANKQQQTNTKGAK